MVFISPIVKSTLLSLIPRIYDPTSGEVLIDNQSIQKTNLTTKEFDDIGGGQIINNCIMIDNSMGPFKEYLPKESK